MISKKIIEAVIKQAKPYDKDKLLSTFITELGGNYSYNDDKVNHCLELLLDETKYISPDDVNIDYIKENFNKYLYKAEEYIIKDIELKSIDNIEGIIYINYNTKEKINEDRDDIDFNQYNLGISFIDNPQVLKKS